MPRKIQCERRNKQGQALFKKPCPGCGTIRWLTRSNIKQSKSGLCRSCAQRSAQLQRRGYLFNESQILNFADQPSDPDKIPEEFGWWLSGFITGEGCFGIKKITNQYKVRIYWYPDFTLGQRANEYLLLKTCMETLGIGTLRWESREQHRRRGNEKNPADMIYWRIRKKTHLRAFAAFLTRFPVRGQKLKEFKIWKEWIEEWCKPKPNFERMEKLAKSLKEFRAQFKGFILDRAAFKA